MFDYIVQPGDTLYKIADYFDVSLQAILNANPGLNPDYLYIGQQLRIPISRFLYQNYPWYYLYPYLFIRYPRRHWDDRRRWPSGRRGSDGRRDRGGWWNNSNWRNADDWRSLAGRVGFDNGHGRQIIETGTFDSGEQEMRYDASKLPDQD